MNRKLCLVLVFAGLVAAVSLGTYRGATSSNLDPGEIVTPTLMPLPRDTIIAHDNGSLLPFFFPDAVQRYWAVLFNLDLVPPSPDSICTLQAGIVAVDTLGDVPTCSLFVWPYDQMNLRPAEPPIFSTEFVPTYEYPIWDTVAIAQQCSGYVCVGLWVENVGFDPLEQDNAMADLNPPLPAGTSWFSDDGRSTWLPVLTIPSFGDLGIRAWVTYFERPPEPVRDVQPALILAPPDTVICNTPYPVEARVQNNGDSIETFDVTFVIDTLGGSTPLHNETRTVNNLGIGATQDINFWPPTFVPPSWDSTHYLLTVYTELAIDDSTWNDTLVDTISGYCLWNHDVKPDSLWGPGDSVWCGDTVDVAAYVTNLGDLQETFYFKILIDDSLGGNVYAESVSTTLNSLQQSIRVFPQWPVPTVDRMNYTVTMVTLLAGDMDPSNDTLAEYVFSRCLRDVGAVSVLVPGDTVYCDSIYDPEAEVTNYALISEDISVEFLVNGYADTVPVTGLAPSETRNVVFAPWQVPAAHNVGYAITVNTIFPEDMNTSNDGLADSTWGMCLGRDVGPASLVWPPDTVYCDSSGDVTARVANLGPVSESFSVEAVIETLGLPFYTDTVNVVDLAPAESTDVVFMQWTVPPRDMITYDVTITTLLGGDSDPGNDVLAVASYGLCAVHDGGVASIDSPPDSVYVDSIYTPTATVENFGNRTETFDVVCTIDGYADTASVVDLGPGLTDQVSFTDWTVPGIGPFTVCVKTLVGDDGDPVNDSLCQTVETFIGVHELRYTSLTPAETRVLQNVPNPFTKTTVVHYTVAVPGNVSLYVYDSSGRIVKLLVDEMMSPGAYAVDWNGGDELGNPLSSGIYFYKLVSGKTVESRKMVLVR